MTIELSEKEIKRLMGALDVVKANGGSYDWDFSERLYDKLKSHLPPRDGD